MKTHVLHPTGDISIPEIHFSTQNTKNLNGHKRTMRNQCKVKIK